ncbi:MAG: hypothetical protein JOY77_05650 [Alphaproteobacteria bacterium]|nr:hypothetical protein [Alphaproteobacteria bacterium]MBV9062396.1 hypothetical protein [Alphaproteobacteria bacterium]
MNKYYFNFRKGDQLIPDRLGMYLPDLDAARKEAVVTWLDLQAVAAETGDLLDCAIEVADAGRETLLTVPFGHGVRPAARDDVRDHRS